LDSLVLEELKNTSISLLKSKH